jgi:hypothetical protein
LPEIAQNALRWMDMAAWALHFCRLRPLPSAASDYPIG